MSRIFFISTNTGTDPYPVYPLGMASVAGALAGRGHEVKQYDFLAAGRDEAALGLAAASFAPDYVCLSLRNIDSHDATDPEGGGFLEEDRRVMRAVRRSTGAPVIIGGPAFSLLPEALLDHLGADYGIVGEGERAACDLIGDLERGRKRPRITPVAAPPLAGDRIPSPLLDGELVPFYVRETGMVNLQTKRGCPHACAYCSYPALEGSRFRHREPGVVVDDIDFAMSRHGVDTFFFADSIFNDPEGRYLELAEELIRRRTGARWAAFFRPQGLDREKLSLLKASGLYALELGTDATSDETLAALNKGFTMDDVFAANAACEELSIPCAHFVMFGGPGETMATLERGLENLKRLPVSAVFAFAGVRLLPGTALRERAVEEGLLDPASSLLRPVYYFSPGVDRAAMEESISRAFKGRRDRVFPPAEGRLRLNVMRRFGYRGLLWDRLLSFEKRPARRRGKNR